MPGAAGNLRVILSADGSSYSQTMQAAISQAKKLGTEMGAASAATRREMGEAKGSIAVLGEEFGVHLPRHVRTFVATLPGVATAMSAAFDAVAIFAIGAAIFEAGKKVSEFIEKNEQAAKKQQATWTALHSSIKAQDDDLELTKVKLENAIAKLEHKPENKLAEAIAEARVEADKLGSKIDEVVKQIEEAVKGAQAGALSKLLLHQTGGTQTGKVLEDLNLKLANIDNGFVQGDPTQLRQGALDEAHRALQPILQAAHAAMLQLQANGVSLTHSSSRVEYETASNADRNLRGLLDVAGDSQIVGQLRAKAGTLGDAQSANRDRLKRIEDEFNFESLLHDKSNQEQLDYWARYLNTFREKTAEWFTIADHWKAAYGKIAADNFKSLMRFQVEPPKIELAGPREDTSVTGDLFGDKATEKDRVSSDRAARGLYEAHQQVMEGRYQAYLDTATGQVVESLNLLTQSFTDAGKLVGDVLIKSIGDFNETIVKVLTSPRWSLQDQHPFRALGHSVFAGASQSALQFSEGQLMKALGFGPKHGRADGYHMWLDNLPGNSSSTGAQGTALHGLLGWANDNNWLGKHFGSIFGSGGMLSHFAAGGAIPSNMPAIVGENGPEIFMPSTSGRIVPNDRAFGGATVHVDARGSGDPAAVTAAVHRAMGQYLPAMGAMALGAVNDRNRRVPGSRR